jgi:hypothetical protein
MAFAFILVMHPAPAEDAMPLSTHDFMEKKKMEEPRPLLPSEYANEELNNESSVNVKYTRKNRRHAHHSSSSAAAHSGHHSGHYSGHHNSRRHHASSSAPKLSGRAAVEYEIRQVNRKYPIQWTADESRQIFLINLFRKKIIDTGKQTVEEAKKGLIAMLKELTMAGKIMAFKPRADDSDRDSIVSMIPPK